MVHFQVGTPWGQLKKPSSPYISWLHLNQVFLNYTKFKTDTLVPCGFLVGAHPGFFRRDEAEEELIGSLGLADNSTPFQLSSRNNSIPIADGTPERFTFQAVVVETAAAHASSLHEKFYELENPATARLNYPYTGGYQFVPMLKSKEWSIQKILQLAKLHESIISNLRPLYLENLQDIHHIVNDAGGSLLEGFLNTSVDGNPIFHSMHNMGHGRNKVLLSHHDQLDSAIDTLGTIHETLFSEVDIKYHTNVFLPPKKVQLDMISACNYSHYATDLLSNRHQLTLDHTTSTKRPRIVHLTYSSAVSSASVSPSVVSGIEQTVSPSTISSLTDKDMDALFERMKPYIASDTSISGITIEELDARMKQSHDEVISIRDGLNTSITSLSTRLDSISSNISTSKQVHWGGVIK
jgi:hypothetical protein